MCAICIYDRFKKKKKKKKKKKQTHISVWVKKIKSYATMARYLSFFLGKEGYPSVSLSIKLKVCFFYAHPVTHLVRHTQLPVEHCKIVQQNHI